MLNRDFSGSPVVKILPSNTWAAGSIPGQGARIPHALQPKNQDIKQKQYCNKFNKDVKKTVLNATLYFKKLVFLNPSLLLITPSIHQ